MRLSLLCLLVVFAPLGPRPAHAQSAGLPYAVPETALPPILRVEARQPAAAGHALQLAQPEEGRPALWLVAGGVAGGGVGMIAGMFIGGVLDGPADEDCIDFCFGPGLILGTLVGETAGIALGVHLANGRRGSLPIGMLASAGMLVLGGLIALEAPEVILVLPAAQIIGAIRAERITGR
ncbi:MAG TPA: hypothetical protein VHG08_04235 [Longimicrobium sp.]|nr:hypothetical protein [Longimicrobium sp.]